MTQDLCISVRFVQPYPVYHGRRDAEHPEWPPSPMRLFQALLNAACLRVRGSPLPADLRQSLQSLEALRPHIVAPRATLSDVGYRTYVPHNQSDLISAARLRGGDEWQKAFRKLVGECRTEKDVRPMRIETVGDVPPTIHYLYPLSETTLDSQVMLRVVRPAVRAITHLGWGIDQVVADASLVDPSTLHSPGERWSPSVRSGRRLRVHRSGSLNALLSRHEQFLDRLRDGDWSPVAPLAVFDQVRYRRDIDPITRPYVVFKLFDENDDTYAHPHARLIHIAGMVRHLVIERMTKNPPRGVNDPAEWVERYVAGHRNKADVWVDLPHAQLSYVPLPSVGSPHTDPAVRRIMIVAPVGDDEVIHHLARQLDSMQLKPERLDHLRGPVFLRRVQYDGVIARYTDPSRTWASFTPVILPGHDDHKPEKTHKLILKALAQSGIDQPCQFEWSAFSHFPKSYSAHKYDRENHQIGYIRPDHLLKQTAVHLRLTFEDGVPGPITLGAGRHCGFGLMAAVQEP